MEKLKIFFNILTIIALVIAMGITIYQININGEQDDKIYNLNLNQTIIQKEMRNISELLYDSVKGMENISKLQYELSKAMKNITEGRFEVEKGILINSDKQIDLQTISVYNEEKDDYIKMVSDKLEKVGEFLKELRIKCRSGNNETLKIIDDYDKIYNTASDLFVKGDYNQSEKLLMDIDMTMNCRDKIHITGLNIATNDVNETSDANDANDINDSNVYFEKNFNLGNMGIIILMIVLIITFIILSILLNIVKNIKKKNHKRRSKK